MTTATTAVEVEAGHRLTSRTFGRWAEQAANVGHCARPVRLRGSATTLDKATGEVLSTYATTSEPDGVAYVRCGNRRASVCPSCSHEYKGDMWHLLAAGAAGGMKGVPETVAAHPLVFATLTAPSFGAVHSTRGGATCRPRSTSARCEHGRRTGCHIVHADDDKRLGQPLCPDCYDYTGHVVWQWWAPELWRRFTITLRRHLAAHLGLTQRAAHDRVRVSFAKVAEFQRRGVVHFHALIRLDGPPRDADAAAGADRYPAPLVEVTAAELAGLVHTAAAAVWFDAPPTTHSDGDSDEDGGDVRRLRFGPQVDARVVSQDIDRDTGRGHDASEGLHPQTVAAYIAKYATKACDDFGLPPRLRDPDTARALGIAEHVCRILAEVHRLSRTGAVDYLGLVKWVPMLGFRGHFATKSRRYSTTLGRLRGARKRWSLRKLRDRLDGHPDTTADDADDLDDDDGESSTLVVGDWSLDGFGWLTAGDAALAATGAAQAREWADAKAASRRASRP